MPWSLEMAPFDRSHTSSYSPFIVTMAIDILHRLRDRDIATYWSKIANFFIPHVSSAPAGGDPVGISWRCLMLMKTEWLGYHMVKKLWRYVKPFSSDTRTLRTDRQTDGRTDRFAISLSRVSMLTRDKNRQTRRQYASPHEGNAIPGGPLSDFFSNFY